MVARLMIAMVLLMPRLASGERLPIRRYTTEDGLPSDRVQVVMRDSSGFMWMGTGVGLSRFDGYGFTNYTLDQGVPGPGVTCLTETADGTIWAGTTAGLTRLAPGGNRFEVVHVGDDVVMAVFEDHAARLWVGTTDGLYWIERDGRLATARPVELSASISGEGRGVLSFAEDRDDSLWIGTVLGLVRRRPDGTVERYQVTDLEPGDDRIFRLLVDHDGRLWVGHVDLGVLVVRPPPPGARLIADGDNLIAAAARQGPPLGDDHRVRWPIAAGDMRHLTTAEGLAGNWVRNSIFAAEDGAIWIGSLGLSRITTDGQVTAFSPAQGVVDTSLLPSAEDSAGNLWIGTTSSGVLRLARGGMVTYDEHDGLRGTDISSVFDDGELSVVGINVGAGIETWIHRFDGTSFVGVQPRLPCKPGWGWNQIIHRSRDGDWWIPSSCGLAHFPAVDRIEALATTDPVFYRQVGGVGGMDVFRIYGDARGDVWSASYGPTSLVRWDHASATPRRYTESDGVPGSIATSFAEDQGCLFIGFEDGQLARSCDGGTFSRFGAAEGIPAGMLQGLYFDHAGRLWIAASVGGAGRIDDPLAPRPHVRTYITTDGLSSNHVNAITEDLEGKIYLATSHGVDRVDPGTGRVHHYGLADGLATSVVVSAVRDHTGALWFGTLRGLSRLVPIPDHAAPLRVLIVGLDAGGIAHPVAQQGARAVDGIELGPDRNQVEISFVGLSAAIGAPVRYQIKLDGVDTDWSAPIDQRSIRYAGLDAGSYRFEVRALTSDGVSPPATVTFRVLGPIWKRGWFLALTAALLVALGYAIHRWRLARRLEVERVRLRIAVDLHDDVGSSLSRIAILSDVVSREVDAGRPVGERLGEISQTARDLVDTTGDIVWSIDPRRDDLDSLIARFRRFVGDLLDGRAIEWSLTAPPDAARLKLSPEQRRHLFLMLKEAVHNVVRHAACTTVTISIAHVDRDVIAEVADDGRGFVATPAPRGAGLANMRARVAAAGGEVEVASSPGAGTRVRIRMPIRR